MEEITAKQILDAIHFVACYSERPESESNHLDFKNTMDTLIAVYKEKLS